MRDEYRTEYRRKAALRESGAKARRVYTQPQGDLEAALRRHRWELQHPHAAQWMDIIRAIERGPVWLRAIAGALTFGVIGIAVYNLFSSS